MSGTESYASTCLARLIHHRELASGRIDISSSEIAQVRTPCSMIGIVHPEGCRSVGPGWYTSGRLALVSEMYTQRVITQFVQDETHRVAFSENALPLGFASGCSAFYVWFCLRGLCKRAVQRMHQKQLSNFYLCLKADFEFLSCI